METTFIYSESAKRRAKKREALEQGEAEQKQFESAHHHQPAAPVKASPLAPAGQPAASAPRAAPAPRAQAARAPAARPAAASAGRPAAALGTRSPQGVRTVQRGALRPPALKASEERLLLESDKMNLFGKTGKKRQAALVCPDCHHELIYVVCLGKQVRVCAECKGTWVPYAAVVEFAKDNDWFKQLGPAFLLQMRRNEAARAI